MTDERQNRSTNNDGISAFLHAIESELDATRSGRTVRFGHGRLSTNVPDNSVEVDIDALLKEFRNGNETGQ